VSWWFKVFQSQAAQVAEEMNHEFEGLLLRVFVGVRVFQDGEELLRLGDQVIAVLMKNRIALTFRACPEPGEGSAGAELKLSATTRNHR